jgi:hypothetical protein
LFIARGYFEMYIYVCIRGYFEMYFYVCIFKVVGVSGCSTR